MMHPLEIEIRKHVTPAALHFLDEAFDGVWIWDMHEAGESWVSPKFLRTFGYEPNELRQGASTWRKIIHPDDWHEAAIVAPARAIETGSIYRATVRYMHKGGHWVTMQAQGTLLRNDGGAPAYLTGVNIDISHIAEMKRQLEHETRHDALTGLLCRRGADEAIDRAYSFCIRHGLDAFAALIDLDDFKQVNTAHGHGAGDHALRELANRMRSVIRISDDLARVGGDEFLAILCVRDRHEAETIVDRINKAIRPPIEISPGVNVMLTASIGVTRVRRPWYNGKSQLEQVIETVALDLITAKTNGKDQASFAAPRERSL